MNPTTNFPVEDVPFLRKKTCTLFPQFLEMRHATKSTTCDPFHEVPFKFGSYSLGDSAYRTQYMTKYNISALWLSFDFFIFSRKRAPVTSRCGRPISCLTTAMLLSEPSSSPLSTNYTFQVISTPIILYWHVVLGFERLCCFSVFQRLCWIDSMLRSA